jgi:hypothetical protein
MDSSNPDRDPDNESIWDADDALASVQMDRDVFPEKSNEQLTKEILDAAGPGAARSIVQLSLHGTNENTRLAAAKYVTDLYFGDQTSGTQPLWEKLVAEAISDVELHANADSDS